MKLFLIDENNEVVVNQPWIKLIPEFKAVFSYFRSKSKSTSQSYSKANKVLAYIYFMADFSSPLKTWNEEDKKKEALRYTSLTEEDLKPKVVQDALAYYKFMLIECCRPYKTYQAALKAMESMDNYLETVNFDDKDKQGKLLYTPNQLVDNLAKTNKAYDEIYKLEKRVETELEQNTGIRGKATMSDREIKFANTKAGIEDTSWDESGTNMPEGPNMVDIAEVLKPKDVSQIS